MTAPPSGQDTLADRVDQALTSTRTPKLRRGCLRFARTVALPVGIQGPTAGVIIGPAIIAGIVGEPGALAQVLALAAMAFVAYAFIRFSRAFNTAGSVYAFNAAALGPGYGFVSAWLLLLVYVSFAAGVYASSADIAQTLLASMGVHIGWLVLALAGAAAALLLGYLSIGLSSLVILACEGLAIALICAVAVAVLTNGGYHHHGLSLAPFSPAAIRPGLLTLGVVAAFGQFSGFEGAATLGEEARHSTRTIPAAIGWSLATSAAVYIFFTWIVYAAFPSAAAVAANPAPLVSVAGQYLGSGVATAVNAAGLVSAFGAQLACLNAGSRLLFALGREVGGGPITRVSRHGSPSGALAVTGVVSVAALLATGFEPTATRAATLIIQYGAYLILGAYLMTVLAALTWAWRTGRSPGPLAALAAGAAVLGAVIYRTFAPPPSGVFGWIALAAAASVLLGAAALITPGLLTRLRRSPLLAAANPAGAAPADRGGTGG
jgi:amino acid transporter